MGLLIEAVTVFYLSFCTKELFSFFLYYCLIRPISVSWLAFKSAVSAWEAPCTSKIFHLVHFPDMAQPAHSLGYILEV